MPNFCRPHAIINSQNKAISLKHINFLDKLKLILYQWVRNSTTHLTLVHSTASKIAVQDHKGKIEMSSQSTKSDA